MARRADRRRRRLASRHRALHEWGKATVVEVENNAQSTTCVLCVGGKWRVADELEGGYVQWRPTRDRGAAGVLTLNRSDGPELDSNVPRLLAFKTPLLEDPSHIHTFIFESPEARAEAGRVLGL